MVAKAKESEQVKRAREKLKQQLAKENKRVTQTALQKMARTIHHWLERHARDRISLKSKNIELFDENRHTAKISNKHTVHLQQHLKQEMKKGKEESLRGRIAH